MKWLFLFVIPFLIPFTSMAQFVPLYSKIPNQQDGPNLEISTNTDGILKIQNVSVPAYEYYRVKVDSRKRPCIIICPGGGYTILAAGHEGADIAVYFNSIGINAIVLKYRIPNANIQPNQSIAPLQDAQQIIRLARLNAKKWGIDADKIGIMGFSAGGHLAASLATHFADVKISNPENISLKPNFQVLIYPVITFRSFGHQGSTNNLIGKNASEDLVHYFSNEEQVSANTPPAFIVHSKEDRTVPVKNSTDYYEALLKNNVIAHLYLFEHGKHGFGLQNKQSEEQWPPMLVNWLQSMGYISK